MTTQELETGFRRGFRDGFSNWPNDIFRFRALFAEGYNEGYEAGRAAIGSEMTVDEAWGLFIGGTAS
jgi:hypothetical protein